MGTETNTPRSPMLQRLYDERDQCVAFVDQTVAGANVEGQIRDLSQSEQESLARTRERIGQIDQQIKPLEEFEQLRSAGDTAARNFRPTPAAQPDAGTGRTGLGMRVEHRAYTYRTRGEVIVDQLRAAPQSMGGQSDPGARERLLSAGCTFSGVSDADVAVARANERAALDQMRNDPQIRATQTTTNTAGILPAPIIGEVMNDVDAARPFITSVGAKALSFAGKTFTRPVVTSHTTAAKQTAEAASGGLGTSPLVISGVTFTKETWGGWLDVSRQDIDWTSPAAWDAILNDLTEQYGLATENAAADAFAAAVTATVENADPTAGPVTLANIIKALYSAASLAYQGGGQLPDTIWASLDMWSTLGPLIETQVSTNQQPGSSSPGSFQGDLLRLPRIVVPSMPNGTLIIGAKRWTEVYEERIGLLTAVQPSALGVQVAYGGYVAYNTLKAAAFAKVVNTA